MSTLLSVLVFFVLFGAMFGFPIAVAVLLIRHRDRRLQEVLREVKRLHRLRGRGRAQLVGRVQGRPLRIMRDVHRGLIVSVDLLPPEIRRRHAQWSRERSQSFTDTFYRLLGHDSTPSSDEGQRIEGRWTFAMGRYPTIEEFEAVFQTIEAGLSQELLLAEVAAAASEPEVESSRDKLDSVSKSDDQPPWLRAEAYRALIDGADERALATYGRRLASAPAPVLRRLSAVAWNRLPGTEAVDKIRSLLRDDHPTVVETAARLLAERTSRDDHAAELLLLERLRNERGPVLFVIVRALGAVGSSRALAEMARWCEARGRSITMREAVWRESARIRAALGLSRAVHGGHLSIPGSGGELSSPKDPEPAGDL